MTADECPSGWSCIKPTGASAGHCYEPAEAGTPVRTGNSMTFTPQGEPGYACGAWQPVHATDAPPTNAVAYGVEYSERGARPEYLCRFATRLDDKPLVVQGRAVFGTACLAALPAGEFTDERSALAAEFEVLVDTEHCARFVTYYADSTRPMPTGTDVNGAKTFSCMATVGSSGLPTPSRYLGRFDPATERCTFEYKSSARNVFARDAGLNESVKVLATPN